MIQLRHSPNLLILDNIHGHVSLQIWDGIHSHRDNKRNFVRFEVPINWLCLFAMRQLPSRMTLGGKTEYDWNFINLCSILRWRITTNEKLVWTFFEQLSTTPNCPRRKWATELSSTNPRRHCTTVWRPTKLRTSRYNCTYLLFLEITEMPRRSGVKYRLSCDCFLNNKPSAMTPEYLLESPARFLGMIETFRDDVKLYSWPYTLLNCHG